MVPIRMPSSRLPESIRPGIVAKTHPWQTWSKTPGLQGCAGSRDLTSGLPTVVD